VARDGRVTVFSLATGRELGGVAAGATRVRLASHDDMVLTTGHDGLVRAWHTPDGTLLGVAPLIPEDPSTSFAMDDGRIVVYGNENDRVFPLDVAAIRTAGCAYLRGRAPHVAPADCPNG
jgi:hypothetical protein